MHSNEVEFTAKITVGDPARTGPTVNTKASSPDTGFEDEEIGGLNYGRGSRSDSYRHSGVGTEKKNHTGVYVVGAILVGIFVIILLIAGSGEENEGNSAVDGGSSSISTAKLGTRITPAGGATSQPQFGGAGDSTTVTQPAVVQTPTQMIPTSVPTQVPSPTATPIPVNLLAYGGDGVGKVTAQGGPQNWVFDGQAGQIVTIRVLQEGGASLNPGAELLDPSGARVTQGINCGFAPEVTLQNLTLKFTGRYTIRVTDGCRGSEGSYRVVLTLKPTSGVLTFGKTSIGGIVRPGDYEDWKIDLTAGTKVTIKVAPYGGATLLDGFSLIDPSGAAEQNHVNCWVPEERSLTATVRFSGTYTIRVADGCSRGTSGGYSIVVLRQ